VRTAPGCTWQKPHPVSREGPNTTKSSSSTAFRRAKFLAYARRSKRAAAHSAICPRLDPIEISFSKLKACLHRVPSPPSLAQDRLIARSFTACEARNYFRDAGYAQNPRESALDGKNRRFYPSNQIQDFFGLRRRKLLYRRHGLSHRRAARRRTTGERSF